jgi:polyhydroxyalkanoate synthesis regulator phasin
MKTKNEPIFLHIIEEDYKESEKKHNKRFDTTGKAIQLDDLQQEDGSVAEQLRKMHGEYAGKSEPESLEVTENTGEIEQPSTCDVKNPSHVSELIAAYQKIKITEQELAGRKQDLLSMQKDLKAILDKEILKKQKAIQTLQNEISELETNCREISQELGISINI